MTAIYEHDVFTQMPDRSMHPGGLRLTDRAVRLAALEAGMLVADVGCGAGATVSHLSSKFSLQVTGLEISMSLAQSGLNRYPGLHLLHWDGVTLPFEDGSLDAVVIECVLSVMGRKDCVLAECARVLGSEGKLIISDVVSRCEPASGTLLTEAGLAQQLRKAGFHIVLREDHTSALRTYVTELRAQGGPDFAVGACLGAVCLGKAPKLSDLKYVLLISNLSKGEG